MTRGSVFTAADHTWVICAWRESPYLEECVRSLLRQTARSGVRIVTSTPCAYIDGIAVKHGLQVFVNHGKNGISGDWNFALRTGETELITIAHQDDVYEPGYTAEMLQKINRYDRPILYFTNYGEIRDGERETGNRLLRIKRLLMIPTRLFPGRRFFRRMSLAFGNAVCCPSVTYLRSVVGEDPFSDRFKSNLDWELTEKLSIEKGQFVYHPNVLMYHRIHEASTTTEIIGDHQRTAEDYEMMKRFWPDGIARRLSKMYAASEKSNQVQK